MLGFNQCGQCTDNYLALIILFTVADIALVVFLCLNVTVPVGIINGLYSMLISSKYMSPSSFPMVPYYFLVNLFNGSI